MSPYWIRRDTHSINRENKRNKKRETMYDTALVPTYSSIFQEERTWHQVWYYPISLHSSGSVCLTTMTRGAKLSDDIIRPATNQPEGHKRVFEDRFLYIRGSSFIRDACSHKDSTPALLLLLYPTRNGLLYEWYYCTNCGRKGMDPLVC